MRSDLATAEMIAIPITVILLLFVFGSLGLAMPFAFGLKSRPFVGAGRVPWKFVLLAAACGLANMGFANFLMGVLRELLPHAWSKAADDVTRVLTAADVPSRIVIVVAAGVAAGEGA